MITLQWHVFDALMHQTAPALSSHFEALGMPLHVFATSWYEATHVLLTVNSRFAHVLLTSCSRRHAQVYHVLRIFLAAGDDLRDLGPDAVRCGRGAGIAGQPGGRVGRAVSEQRAAGAAGGAAAGRDGSGGAKSHSDWAARRGNPHLILIILTQSSPHPHLTSSSSPNPLTSSSILWRSP